jgi:predicted FMN-binding regulatory protein PaiB
MNKITKSYLQDYVAELGEFETEQVIPAHYVTKQKTEVFVPTWEG